MSAFIARLASLTRPAGRGARRARVAVFKSDRSGEVSMLFGILAIVMFLLVGGAIDVARWLHARTQTIAAVDAAVLAGGRSLQLKPDDTTAAVQAAVRYYDANIETRLPLKSDNIGFTVVETEKGMAVTATGSATIETPFLTLANIPDLPLLSVAKAEYSEAKLATGANAKMNYEISMMLDITGSMCNTAPGSNQSPCTSGTKINDMKAAAKDLINIVVWEDQSEYTSKVAIVPFTDSVRVPSNVVSQVMGTPAKSVTKSVTTTTGSGKNKKTTTTDYQYNRTEFCVVERAGTNKYTDVAPGSGNFAMPIRWQVNNGSTAYSTCTVLQSNEVIPLTNNKANLIAKIDSLAGKGGTAGQVGTAWAWYMLSPNWASLWPAANRPKAYGTADLQKIAILMTDGEYNTEYTSDGIKTGSNGAGTTPANDGSANQAKALCTAMKNKNITVYTVGFALGGNQTAINTLNHCATTPGHFFNAANGEELRQAFRTIALEISQLYLSK